MPKTIVFCFDGTWNRLSADVPTNVAKVAQMIQPLTRDGKPQIVYYDEGIGTHTNWVNQRYQGITGKGLMTNLREAYRFMIFNYEPGDHIYAFGFSRGAFTARSFIGLIRHAGILDVVDANKIDKAISIYRTSPAGKTGKESGLALRFRLRHCRGVCVSEKDREFRMRVEPEKGHDTTPLLNIAYLGVWDTVSALGIPAFLPGAKWINAKYGFHDAVLTSKIQSARHAVAIDELRPTFRPTLFDRAKVAELNTRARDGRDKDFEEWQTPYQEKWFPGVHGAVGGGGARRGLSDGALAWVLAGATRAGLRLRNSDDAQTFLLSPNSRDHLNNAAAKTLADRWPIRAVRGWFHSPRKGPVSRAELALSTFQRWFSQGEDLPDGKLYRPGALAPISSDVDGWPYANLTEYKSEHIVQKGDTLYSIAEKYLGDGMRYMEIFEANRDRIDDPDHILPGTVLRIVIPKSDRSGGSESLDPPPNSA